MQHGEGLFQRLFRAITPDTRKRQLRGELGFWRQWLATKGLEWPDDYALRFDPDAPIQQHVAIYIDRLAGPRVEILDVGSGPVTKLGKVHPSKTLSITAIDMLAEQYEEMLKDFAVTPLVVTQFADAEKLRDKFGNRKFDLVHAENSLDHTNEPVAALGEMLAVARPGGFVVLLHQENEGMNESYQDLHKWDFTCEVGHFIISGPGPNGPRRDITRLFSADADVECRYYDGDVLVGLKKRIDPTGR